jgi:type II secretory pathway pseudopilin PulG
MMNTKYKRAYKGICRGISLLEVILAIAIMGGSIAALSSVVMNGASAATDARDRALAQMLCEQQMAQLLIQNIMPVAVNEQPLQSPDPNLTFTLTTQINPAPLNGLLSIQMLVSGQAMDSSQNPVQVMLVRWMIDPNLGLEQAEADEQAAAEEAAGGETNESSDSGSGDSI